MRKINKSFLVVAFMFTTAVLSYAYAACYTRVYQPQCARPGDCFGECTPMGCQTATCIQATGFGYEDWYNLVPGYGGYPWRSATDNFNTCIVGSCRIYNNCTHAYENLPPDCHCGFPTIVYTGSQTG